MTDAIMNPNIDTEESDINLAVAKGAALLDEKRPTWFQHIDLELLVMEDFEFCIIGQLANAVGETRFNEELEALDIHGKETFGYGFDMPGHTSRWSYLQGRWEDEVSQRMQDWADSNG